MKRHAGFTTFTVTLLLILILVGISLLVGKLMVTDRKISVNEVQYRQALALAELGIADGLGRLKANADWRGSITANSPLSSAPGTYLLSASSSLSTVTVGTPPNTKVFTPVVLGAEATLADGLGKAQVQVMVAGYSLMTDAKVVPLMAPGVNKLVGSLSIVTDPNGGGPGVPLSVWTDQPYDGRDTCYEQDYSGGKCNATISSNNKLGPDIKTSDIPLPPNDSLLSYLFGVPDSQEGWNKLYENAMATPPSSSCGALGSASTGIYIVDSPCIFETLEVGTPKAPVVLILKDAAIRLKTGMNFYGIIFSYSTNPAIPPDITFEGSASVYGAIVSNATIPFPLNANGSLIYDKTVMSSIQTGASFQATKMIPGSWKDWLDEEGK